MTPYPATLRISGVEKYHFHLEKANILFIEIVDNANKFLARRRITLTGYQVLKLKQSIFTNSRSSQLVSESLYIVCRHEMELER